MLMLQTILYVRQLSHCEFVPSVNIDPKKLLLRTRTKTTGKLEFGAMDGPDVNFHGWLEVSAVNSM